MEFKRNIIVTGGAGFIGSHVVRLFVTKYPDYRIINLDALTYAGNLENLKDVENCPNYVFVKGDICDHALVSDLFARYDVDGVIHLAAESHVDRSIEDPFTFARTNVMGTLTLLHAARTYWSDTSLRGSEGAVAICNRRFYHVSTDEVYGALEMDGGFFTEDTRYDPHSPYSASKASSDHFVRAFHDTYGLPTVISNCSNNYGPYQFPEKLIPLFINNIRNRKPLPVYGKGENVRDWLHVSDHCQAIDLIIHNGRVGEVYNVGGHNERTNLEVVQSVCRILDELRPRSAGKYEDLIEYVADRPGHDLRYAIDPDKLMNRLGWRAEENFDSGIRKTVEWYLDNEWWWKPIREKKYSGERLGKSI